MSNSPFGRPWWEDDSVWRPSGEENEPISEPSEARPVRPLVECWRCGKEVEEDRHRCPMCRALLSEEDERQQRREAKVPHDTQGLLPMLGFYIGIMLPIVIGAIIARSWAGFGELNNADALRLMTVIACVDALLVVVALCAVPAPPRLPKRTGGEKALCWTFALPLLAGLLGINFLYHRYLQNSLGLPMVDMTFGQGPWSPVIVLLVCVQPAIFEELFFRYLALGVLRRHMGLHGAVLVSSIMFALAHVGALLSLPVLALIGLLFGYLRVGSRSIVLPMILHFLHNLAVLHIPG